MKGRLLFPILICLFWGLAGCADVSVYTPVSAARGELVVRAHRGFEMHAGGQKIAHSPVYEGLAEYVLCVEPAHREALAARRAGRGALALQIGGGLFIGLGLGGLAGVISDDLRPLWIAGSALSGIGFGMLAWSTWLLPRAHGHAFDALNYYNDAVGSVGASCADPQPDPPLAPPAPPPPPIPPAAPLAPVRDVPLPFRTAQPP